MLRKKKRQSGRGTELANGKDQQTPLDMSEMEGTAEHTLQLTTHSNNESSQDANLMEVEESNKGQLDLNCHPSREEDMLAEAAAGFNMASLIDAASIPLDMYMRQNVVSSLGHLLPSHVPSDCEGSFPGEGRSTPADVGLQKKCKDD